jgi:hypothetical protein
MRSAQTKSTAPTRSHRPRAITVFAAAFVAGAAAAVGVNRALDVRMAQSKPRVESEAIFVALRSLPQGAPVTVWDVALRDWPKAMMPASALRASDTFSGHVLKHPLREGQPLLSIQLAPTGQGAQPAAEPTTFPPPAAYTNASTPQVPLAERDIWSPAEPVTAQATPATQQPAPQAVAPVAVQPVAVQPVAVQPTPTTTSLAIAPSIAAAPAAAPVQLPAQDTFSQQEPSAPTAPAAVEPTATVAAADGPAMATDTTEPASTSTSPTSSSPTSSLSSDNSAAVPAEAEVRADAEVAAKSEVADSPTPAAEPVPASATVPQPQAGPEATAAADVAPPAAPVAASDMLETVVAQPARPAAPAPLAVAPPTPAAPVNIPRPTHLRYLVVPESIAIQADASFAARPAAPEQPAAEPTQAASQTASRSGSNAVRPLPSTTSADRSGQVRSSQSGPQGKTPQRQGRQAQPASPGTPGNATPQPRLGKVMFPNLSAGISGIDGQIRGGQPAPAQGPIAAQPRPLTAR